MLSYNVFFTNYDITYLLVATLVTDYHHDRGYKNYFKVHAKLC